MRTRVPSCSLQPLFRGARVHVGRLRLGAAARAAAPGVERLLDQRFGFAHREAARNDVARERRCAASSGEREQRARVSHRQAPAATSCCTSSGSLSSRSMLATVDAILADRGGDGVLRQVELVGEAPVGESLLRSG